MNAHLGYPNNNHDYKETQNRRNGYGSKTLKTTYGEIPINVPRYYQLLDDNTFILGLKIFKKYFYQQIRFIHWLKTQFLHALIINIHNYPQVAV